MSLTKKLLERNSKIEEAYQHCIDNNESLEYTIQYISNNVEVDEDVVINFLIEKGYFEENE